MLCARRFVSFTDAFVGQQPLGGVSWHSRWTAAPFDPESGFEYYICFKPESQVEGDEVRSRISLEVAVSVTETGDIADLSFMLPKVCRTDYSLSFLKRDPAGELRGEPRLSAHPRPERRCRAGGSRHLELDNAGRIVAVEINGCIPHTTHISSGSRVVSSDYLRLRPGIMTCVDDANSIRPRRGPQLAHGLGQGAALPCQARDPASSAPCRLRARPASTVLIICGSRDALRQLSAR